MEDTLGYLIGLAGLIVGYIIGKMTGAMDKHVGKDQITGKAIKADNRATVAGGSVVGGNQANDKSKQNN